MKLIEPGALQLLLLSITFSITAGAPSINYRSGSSQFFYSKECNTEFPLSIYSDSNGVTLSVLNGNSDLAVLHLPGQKLPSDAQCGEDNFRCKNPLLVKNSSLNSTTVFVPLHNALLLAKFVLNSTGLTLEDHHLINLTSYNCTPVTSFEIISSAHTICLNKEASYLAFFEIRLNSESLSRTYYYLVEKFDRNFFDIQSPDLSEFKYINYNRLHRIFFALASYLYYFHLGTFSLNYAGGFNRSCSSVKELVYSGNSTLIVYCRDRAAAEFDLDAESTLYQPYSSYGRPFVCPDSRKVILQDGYLRFSQGESITLDLIGQNLVSGACFGDSSDLRFAYVDQLEGTFVLDLKTFNFTQLSTQSCFNSNQKCKPVEVLLNQYLIIQTLENNHQNFTASKSTTTTALQTVVFDTKNNFKTVATLNETGSVISIIASHNTKPCPSVAPIIHTSTTASAIDSGDECK